MKSKKLEKIVISINTYRNTIKLFHLLQISNSITLPKVDLYLKPSKMTLFYKAYCEKHYPRKSSLYQLKRLLRTYCYSNKFKVMDNTYMFIKK